jgi:hypothetical protein
VKETPSCKAAKQKKEETKKDGGENEFSLDRIQYPSFELKKGNMKIIFSFS